MCGRTRCTLGEDQVARVAGTRRWVDRERYRPTYNMAPGAPAPVVRVASDGEVQIQTMRWGLIPSFTKKDEKPDFYRMFNARSESVAEKPSFRRLVPTRRCLVLAEGFFEWVKEKGSVKQPYYVHLAGPGSKDGGSKSGMGDHIPGAKGQESGDGAGEAEPLVMAGLWDVWDGPDGEGPMHTYTILTTDSCKRLQWLHDRMPVILRTGEAQQAWLRGSGDTVGKLLHLCVPYNGDDLVWHPVTRQMNTPAFQGPECVKELKKPAAADFFKRRSAAGTAGAAVASPPPAAAAAVKVEPKAEQIERKAEFVSQQEAAAVGLINSDFKQQQLGDDAHATAAAAGVKAEPWVEEEAQGGGGGPAGLQGGAPESAAAVNADEQPLDRQQAAAAAAAAGQQLGSIGGVAEYSHQEHARQVQRASPAAPLIASPGGQKRKHPPYSGGAKSGPTGGSGGKTGSGSAAASKKARPADQPPISRFFSKAT